MRRSIASALVGAALIVGALAGWLVAGDDDPGDAQDASAIEPTLVDVDTVPDAGYRYPRWWTDGESVLRLTPGEDAMTLLDPLASHRDAMTPARSLRSDAPVEPSAVAALPGGGGAPWVAVAVPYDASPEDGERIARLKAWSGTPEPPDADDVRDPGDPSELPIDTTAKRIGGAEPIVDVAVAEIDGEVVALTTTYQRERRIGGTGPTTDTLLRGAARCDDLGGCRWRTTSLPDAGLPLAVASTGRGFVLVTGEPGVRGAIWYADDAGLAWRRIATKQAGSLLTLAQDGPDGAVLVLSSGEEDAEKHAVHTVAPDGTLERPVPAAPAPPGGRGLSSVLHVDGEWLIGGARDAGEGIALRYDASTPLLLRLEDGRWETADHPLLAAQVDQGVEALVVPSDGHDEEDDEIDMATHSAVGRIGMLWRLEVDD